MATELKLQNKAASGLSGNYGTSTGARGWFYDLATAFGDGVTGATTDTAASGTNIPVTNSTTNDEKISWITPPLTAGFTLTSVDISVWALESSMNANVTGRARIFKVSPAMVETEVAGGPFDDNVEFGTASALQTWTANVTDTAFAAGDRIQLRLYLTNAPALVMAAGFTAQYAFNGTTDGIAGDSVITLAENVTFETYANNLREVVRLHFDGADASTTITDDSPSHHVFECKNSAHIDTSQSKFGVSSMRFTRSSSDYVQLQICGADFTDFMYPGGGALGLPFTWDFWIRLNSLPSTNGEPMYLLDWRDPGESDTSSLRGMMNIRIDTSNHLVFTWSADRITGTTALTTGAWHHVALTRANGIDHRLFLNGVQEGSTSSIDVGYLCAPNAPRFGINGRNIGLASPECFDGWMDEMHAIRGTASWTAGFTPPTVAYSDPVTASLAYNPQPAYMTPLLVR